ncbi:hypothetical protein P350_13295 [Burkholderia cepacia JBK9]|nr:hypothetical protein P350_13295 [Burkholderia cepacia JBK9]
MDITSLGIALDTSDLKQGESALNSAAAAANKAADAMDNASGSASKMASQYSGLSDSTQQAAAAMNPHLAALKQEYDLLGLTRSETEAYIARAKGLSDAERQVAAALGAKIDAWHRDEDAARQAAAAEDQAAKSADAFIARLKSQVDAMGKTSAELLQMKAATLGVSSQAAPLIAQLEGAGKATGFLANSTAYARTEMMRLVNDVANGNWRRFEQTGMVLAEQYDLLGKIMTPVGLAVTGVTLAIGASAAAAIHAAEALAQYGDSVTRLHQQTGVSTDEIQKFTYAMTVVSGSGKDAGVALDSLAKNIGRAQQGAGRTLGDFAALGISMKDLKSLSFDEVLGKIADKFSQTADDANKYTVAQQLFGGAAKDMIPLLDRGSAGLAELGVQAQNVGAVLDRETIAKMYELDEELNTIHANFDAVSMQAKSTLVPTLLSISTEFAHISEKGEIMNTFFEVAKGVMVGAAVAGTVVAGTLDGIITSVGSLAKASSDILSGNFSQAGQDIKSGYDERKRQFQEYVDSIKNIWEASTRPGESPIDIGNGPGWGGGDRIQLRGRKTGGARTNDSAVNADLADLQNQQRMIEDALKGSLEHIKALRQQGVIDEKDAIAQSYGAEQTALQQRIDIDRQQLEIATGKKNSEAYRKYADDIERLQGQMLNNYKKFGDEIATYDAKQAAAIKAYSDSLDEQLATLQTAASTKLAGLSMGTNDRADFEQQIKIREDYDKRKAGLTKSLTENRIDKRQFDGDLKVLEDFYSKEVALARSSSADIKAANADWTTGARRAIAEYGDEAANIANSTASLMGNAFKGMEDSLVQFATTGKLSFKSLADGIIADIVRMEVRMAESAIIGLIFKVFGGGIGLGDGGFGGGVFGTLASTVVGAALGGDSMGDSYISGLMGPSGLAPIGTRANGGDVGAGQTYLVGENGPELFRSHAGGTIIPNNAIGGGNQTVVNVKLVEDSSKAGQVDQKQSGSGVDIVAYVSQIARKAVAGDMASGQGDISKALSHRFGLTPRFR